MHGFMPETMLLSTIIPIPKDPNGTGQKSDSYIGIALSALCTKVFEYVILNMHSDSLISNNLQFAYKSGMFTAQCTWAAREVISYYNNKGSDVYCSKAFDLIKHDKLLEKLVSKDVPPVIIRVLTFMYINGKARVKWNKEVSEYFNVSNGVRQCSVLSPYLFSIYIDELIENLEKSGKGCWVGKQFYDVLVYANNIKLLAPSLTALQSMVDMF